MRNSKQFIWLFTDPEDNTIREHFLNASEIAAVLRGEGMDITRDSIVQWMRQIRPKIITYQGRRVAVRRGFHDIEGKRYIVLENVGRIRQKIVFPFQGYGGVTPVAGKYYLYDGKQFTPQTLSL